MAWRRRWLAAGLVVVFGALAVGMTGCGDDDSSAPVVEQPDATGLQLATRYMTLLQQKDAEGLRSFLSDAFLIQRADGSWASKEEYLGRLPEIREYTIQGVTAKQDGPVLTVKWELVVDQTINGQTYKADPAPRLSSFVWNGEKWCLASHANFNTPVAGTPTPAAGR